MSCSTQIPNLKNGCSLGDGKNTQWKPGELRVAKVIYNYQAKTDQQIKDAVQSEIDYVLLNNPAYKFVDSKSHFNKTGGIDLLLNFELK